MIIFNMLAYIIHSGFISGYQNRYGDNLKPPTNVYHRMTAWCRVINPVRSLDFGMLRSDYHVHFHGADITYKSDYRIGLRLISDFSTFSGRESRQGLSNKLQGVDRLGKSW